MSVLTALSQLICHPRMGGGSLVTIPQASELLEHADAGRVTEEQLEAMAAAVRGPTPDEWSAMRGAVPDEPEATPEPEQVAEVEEETPEPEPEPEPAAATEEDDDTVASA
jgi:hypothetical protein